MNPQRNVIFYKDCLGLNPIDKHYYVSKTDINPATGKMFAINPSSGVWDDNYWAQNEAKFNGGVSNAGGNNPIPQQTDLSALFKTQQSQENQLIQNIKDKISSQETLPNAYTRLSTEQGVPQLQSDINTYNTQIANTKDLLDKLEGNINERTQGTMTTEAQRERLLAAEQTPLETTLGRLGAGEAPIASELATAQGNVQNELSAEQQQQQTELQPDMLALSTFTDQAARETTGYTQENQQKLDLYIDQLNNNQQLSLEQMREANTLAQQEKEFQNQKALNQQQYENTYKALGKYGLINTYTGQTIGSGSSSNSSGGGLVNLTGF